jgi:hypothetical protein
MVILAFFPIIISFISQFAIVIIIVYNFISFKELRLTKKRSFFVHVHSPRSPEGT